MQDELAGDVENVFWKTRPEEGLVRLLTFVITYLRKAPPIFCPLAVT
jgi:hypothetical protein